MTKVVTVAAEVASDKLYVLDDETGSAEKINTEDVKTQSTESWADQVTESFAEYYQSKEVNDHLAAVVETAAVKTVRYHYIKKSHQRIFRCDFLFDLFAVVSISACDDICCICKCKQAVT